MKINTPTKFRTFFDRRFETETEASVSVPVFKQLRPPSPVRYIEPTEHFRSNYHHGIEELEIEVDRLEEPQAFISRHDSTPDKSFAPKRGEFSDDQFARFEEKLAEYRRMVDMEQTSAWEFEGREKGLKLWMMKDPVFLVLRTEIELDVPLESAVAHFYDPAFRQQTEKNTGKVETVRTFSDEISVLHACLQLPWPLSDREVLFYRVGFMDGPDSHTTLHYDVNDIAFESKKGMVRVNCELAGTTFKRLGPNKTLYTNFSKSNPRMTGIPMWLLRSKAKDIGKDAICFKELAEKLSLKTIS